MYIQKQLIPPPQKKKQHILIIWPLYNIVAQSAVTELVPQQVQSIGCSYSVYTSLSLIMFEANVRCLTFKFAATRFWVFYPYLTFAPVFTKPWFSFAGCELRTRWQSSDSTVSCEAVRSDGSDAREAVAPCDRPPDWRLTHRGCLHQLLMPDINSWNSSEQVSLTASGADYGRTYRKSVSWIRRFLIDFTRNRTVFPPCADFNRTTPQRLRRNK